MNPKKFKFSFLTLAILLALSGCGGGGGGSAKPTPYPGYTNPGTGLDPNKPANPGTGIDPDRPANPGTGITPPDSLPDTPLPGGDTGTGNDTSLGSNTDAGTLEPGLDLSLQPGDVPLDLGSDTTPGFGTGGTTYPDNNLPSTGGTGTSTTPYVRTSVPFYTPKLIDTFVPLINAGYRQPVDGLYYTDLNKNGTDEVVIAGRMTQPATVETWSNYNMQIYGWNNGGNFGNETKTWFPNNTNQIIGAETVKFGDFNGDGNVDMLVPHSTDMELYGPTLLYINSGSSSFTRNELDLGRVWSHDAVVADFNRDGISDLLVTDYSAKPAIVFGAQDNNFTVAKANSQGVGSSGVSAADYLGNGTTTIIMSDVPTDGIADTKLYSWQVNNGELVLTEIATLPPSRFYLSKWNSARANANWEPHEIRNMSMDFNRDGRTDVIVFSILPEEGVDMNHHEIQFLRNDGNGKFTDVTDEVLVDFNTSRSASYHPTIVDINNDGLQDILISARSHSTEHESTSVLLQTSDGKFVNSYGTVFADFANQIRNSTSNPIDGFPQIGIIKGPDEKLYLISSLSFYEDGTVKNAVYLAEVGQTGTITAPVVASTMKQVWPWMSDADVNEVLAKTSELTLNGTMVINTEAAFAPVGSLSMALEGRFGPTQSITGYIAGVNFNNSDMIVSAVDELRRDFRIDLSPMSAKRFNHWTRANIQQENFSKESMSHAQNLVGSSVAEAGGFRVSQASNELNMFSIGTPRIKFGPNFGLHAQMTSLNFSPWVQMDGVWGKVTNTLITELVGSYSADMFVLNAGLMHAITEIEPGLVRNVSDIVSVWSEVGIRDKQSGFSIFTGIKPWALNGSVDATIPVGINKNGEMQYRNVSAPIQNSLDGYVRVGYTAKLSERASGTIGGIWFTNGSHGIMGSLKLDF